MRQLPRHPGNHLRRDRRARSYALGKSQAARSGAARQHTTEPHALAQEPAATQAALPNAQLQPHRRPGHSTGRVSGGTAMTVESLAPTQVAERESTRASSLLAWFSSVDHKQIGLLYICTALVFLLIGGAEALAIRLQLV